MDIEKTIKNLKARHFSVQHFASGEEACKYLLGDLKVTSPGIGASKTGDHLGLYSHHGDYVITETRFSGTGASRDLRHWIRRTPQRCSSQAQMPSPKPARS